MHRHSSHANKIGWISFWRYFLFLCLFFMKKLSFMFYPTQPDGTLFFLIFTYLRSRSYWNSRDYGLNVAICHFLKPATNKGDFRLYFLLVEKSCRGRHHSEILKTNTKTLIYSIWIRPQGSLGCQNVRQGPLNPPFEVWCPNIAPKLKNFQNTLRKQGFFDLFFQFWRFFDVCAFLGQY